MRIIEDWREKIKWGRELFLAHEKDLFIALVVILACVLSYGLGRLSKIKSSRPPVTISMPDASSSIQMVASVSAGVGDKIVASKNGTKYYLPWCGGSKNIKMANRITFNTEKEAETAGYTRAANCSTKP